MVNNTLPRRFNDAKHGAVVGINQLIIAYRVAIDDIQQRALIGLKSFEHDPIMREEYEKRIKDLEAALDIVLNQRLIGK